MKTFSCWFAVLLIILSPASVFAGKISGVVKLPKGENIPPKAKVLVELRDVSRLDASSMLIGRCDVRDGEGRNEGRFEIEYDDKKIVDANSYAVSCRISSRGRLLFINDTHVPVITGGAPKADIVLPVRKVSK